MSTGLAETRGASCLAGAARARVAASNDASERFFTTHSGEIARACQAMALRFRAGGRLLVYADAPRASDVAHAVVEFMHPVVVGKRALPAMRLAWPSQLALLGRRGDILLLFGDASFGEAGQLLPAAEAAGILAIALVGASGGTGHASPVHHEFVVPSDDACIVQEPHEMLYHVLWELVHVFLDHGQADS